ncbi:MAG: ATP-binding protein, partial [Acidobacteriota bacterium]
MSDAAFQELLDEFLLEARERADACETQLLAVASGDAAERREALTAVKRELHTLKGNSGMMGFTELQEIAHQLEDEVEEIDLDDPDLGVVLADLDRLRAQLATIAGPDEDESTDEPDDAITGSDLGSSVRVSFARIDHMVEMLAETLIFRNRLSDALGAGKSRLETLKGDQGGDPRALVDAYEQIEIAHTALEKTLSGFQEAITELGMVPLQILFRSLGRIVHDESVRESKSVDFKIHGGDTPIDKTLLEVAGEALGHLVRNAVIHGIETPETRQRAGKPATGTIAVTAAIEGGEVVIAVADDGGGIDLDALRDRAHELFGNQLGDDEGSLYEVLFYEGVSTRHGTDLSAGRGVGMAAVRSSVERRNGRVEVSSERGRGSTFTLRLPLTASILRSLLIEADGETYALPMTAVV